MICTNYNTSHSLFNNSIKETSIRIAKIIIVAGVVALLASATLFTSGIALSIGGPVFNFWLLENSVAGLAWGATVGLGASAIFTTPIAYTSNMHNYSSGKNITDTICFFKNTTLFTIKTVGFCILGGVNNLGKIALSGYILSLIK